MMDTDLLHNIYKNISQIIDESLEQSFDVSHHIDKSILTEGFKKLYEYIKNFNPDDYMDLYDKPYQYKMLDCYIGLYSDIEDMQYESTLIEQYPELAMKVVVDKTMPSSPASMLISTLVDNFHFLNNQFKVTSNDVTDVVSVFDISDYSYNDIWVTFADNEYELSKQDSVTNIHILDLICANHGYVRVATKQKDGKYAAIYHPAKPLPLDIIAHNVRYIYHFSPSVNNSSILDKGIIPMKSERIFHYKDNRAFYYLDTRYKTDTRFLSMLKGMAKSYINILDISFNGIYNIYEVDMTGVTSKFYWDYNGKNCIYTNDAINNPHIKLIGTYDVFNNTFTDINN